MRYKDGEQKIFGFPNKLDEVIRDRAHTEDPAELELYKVRWIWYHTILAAEIFLTNVLLIGLIVVTILK